MEKLKTDLAADIPLSKMLKEHVLDIQQVATSDDLMIGLFKCKPAVDWLKEAKLTPMPKMLFSELWHEGELCILFSDSNIGKSILAVQIADSISNGNCIYGFKFHAQAQKVLYFDFELSPKQFELRYACENKTYKCYENHYSFNPNFIRIEMNPECNTPTNMSDEEYISQSFEQVIVETQAKVIIVDNITYLKSETERAKDALPLIKHLKYLKNKYSLSILALAHTPKRDMTKPITQNDLGGSKMIYNFIDSCFAIGKSCINDNLRYIKQVKARNTATIYGMDNIIICEVEKQNNFLGFKFCEFGQETEHLKEITENYYDERAKQALELKNSGMSNVKIASQFGVSESAVRKWLKKNGKE